MPRLKPPGGSRKAVPSRTQARGAKNIIAALGDPGLFGGMFDAPSWEPWKAFLEALQALPMSDAHLALYRHHTGRAAPPTKPARYAELVCGRGGAKTRVLALPAVYLACCVDHKPYLTPGERAVIAVIAKDRQQAKVILGYIVGFLREIPLFAGLIETEQAESLHLNNSVSLPIYTASIGAPRGRTFLAVLCDELAFWVTGEGANPDVEVINAVRPGLSTIPYSLLLIASSPYAKRGVLYQNYAKYFGKDDAPVLVWQGSTEEMNSSLVDDPLIAEMYLEDPERAAAEFGAQFRSDIVQFITREAVEACTAHGAIELPASAGILYAGFVGPSGGSADSFTWAVGHCEASGLAVLDAIREVKPPFSPDAVVKELADLLKGYGLSRVMGDNYAGEWPKERFAVHGIQYDPSPKNKSTIYQEFLPALNGQRVRLLDSARLTGQLCGLERRTARGGRDSIDHGPGGAHDDVANSVAGVLTHILADRRPALVRPEHMSAPAHLTSYEPPLKASSIVGVLSVDESGMAAYVLAAQDQAAPNVLSICDFAVEPMSRTVFTAIAEKMDALVEQCRATHGSGLFVHENLVAQARHAGVWAHPIPPEFKAEERLFSVAGHVAEGMVRIASQVIEKAKTSPFAGALNLRAGEGTDDALRCALVSVIALSLDNESLAA